MWTTVDSLQAMVDIVRTQSPTAFLSIVMETKSVFQILGLETKETSLLSLLHRLQKDRQ